MKTLEDVLKGLENDTTSDLGSLLRDAVEAHDKKKHGDIIDRLKAIEDSHAKLTKSVKALSEKPEKELPPFPKFPEKMAMDRPDWYSDGEPVDYERVEAMIKLLLKPILSTLIFMSDSHESLQDTLKELGERKSEPEAKDEPKAKLPMQLGSIRRHSRWQIATFPNLPGTSSITSKGDNLTFYLPSAPIKNSETIRLNQGIPLSQGIDYTLSGNAITFIQNQSGSQMEVRYQN